MISVVIPTYNEQLVIKDCIESLLKQKKVIHEIIIVDDGSTDDTVSIVRFLGSTHANISVFKKKHKGPGEARNYGASKGKGSILVFVDSDMTFDPLFLFDLTKPIIDKESKGTFSLNEYVSNWENAWARCWNYNQGINNKHRISRQFSKSSPVFRAIERQEFEKVGGFSSIGYTDDWTLSRKLGYKATIAPHATYYHKNPDTLESVFKQARWIGKNEFITDGVRKYINLVHYSIPLSVIIGVYKSFVYREYRFIVFKLVYDSGVFKSILEAILCQSSKYN